jgi:hypothetical protein
MCVSVAEVSGTPKSVDPLWNNSKIIYWGVTDLLDGKLSQRGYYNSINADKSEIGSQMCTFPPKLSRSCGFFERCDRIFRLVEYLKQGHKLCNLKHLVCTATDAGKPNVPADFSSRRVHGHQSTQATAVDISHIPEIEYDLAGFAQ